MPLAEKIRLLRAGVLPLAIFFCLIACAIAVSGAAAATAVRIERSVEDGIAVNEPMWIGIFDDPITSGADARRWLSSDKRVTSFNLLENERPANLVILVPDSAVPIVRKIELSVSETSLAVGAQFGRDLIGEARTVGGNIVSGAEISIAEVAGWASELPAHVRPRWRTSAEGDVVIPCAIAGRYEVSAVAHGFVPLVKSIDISEDAAWRFALELLPTASAIAGRVVGPTGLGIEGAKVVAEAGSLTLEGVSGKDGRFALGPFKRAQEVRITALSGQDVSLAQRVLVPKGDLEIELRSATSISGVVFDRSTNAPVDSFQVTVRTEGGQAHTETFHDVSGRFAMDLSGRAATIEIRASGYAPWTRAPSSEARRNLFVEVALEHGRVLAGYVVAAASGRPIAGATVEAAGYMKDGVGLGATSASTDASGRFELRAPKEERRLRASAAGYAAKTVRAPAGRLHTLEIHLADGKEIAGELVLPDGAPATGHVTLASVWPHDHALDFWEVRELLGGRRKATVQTDGRFRFADLAVGRYRVYGRSPLGAVADQTVEIAQHTTSLLVRLTVEPLAKVVGSVAGLAHGEHATLFVEEAREDDARSIDVVNVIRDVANGPFEITGIPNGEFLLRALSTADREVLAAFEIADLRDAEVDVAFLWSSRLTGRVLIDGQGAGGVDVFATYATTHTGAPLRTRRDYTASDGTYDIRGLADGYYEVVVKGNRFNVEVQGETEVDLPLASNSLSGAVFGLGRPLEGEIVVARPLGEPSTEVEQSILHTRTGSGGEFRFEGLPEGPYAIVVMDPFSEGAVREAYVNGEVTGFDFHLQPPNDLRTVQVALNTGSTHKVLWVKVHSGAFNSVMLDVPLDANGTGHLPTSLQGADLSFRLKLSASPAVVPSWDGEAIVVEVGDE